MSESSSLPRAGPATRQEAEALGCDPSEPNPSECAGAVLADVTGGEPLQEGSPREAPLARGSAAGDLQLEAWQRQRRRQLQARLADSLGPDHALFSVLIDATGPEPPAALGRTLQSLQLQDYANVEVVVLLPAAGPHGADLEALEAATAPWSCKRGLFVERLAADAEPLDALWSAARRLRGDYLLLLRPGAELEPHGLAALNVFRLQALAGWQPELILVDHLEMDADGQGGTPFLYPGWDPDFLASAGFQPASLLISPPRFQRAARAGCGSLAELMMLASRDLEPADPRMLHVSELLLRVPKSHRLQGPASVTADRPPADLLLTIVIPHQGSRDQLERCLRFATSQGQDFGHDVIIVIHADAPIESWELCRRLAGFSWCRLMVSGRSSNRSQAFNLAAKAACGEVLLLLQDDVEIEGLATINPCLRQIIRPEVGAVGTSLHARDGSLQHAGLLCSAAGGGWQRLQGIRGNWQPAARDYFRHCHNYQAVGAGFLLVKKSDFDAVGGFNELDFPLDGGEVEFCLRLRDRGLRVLCVPPTRPVHVRMLPAAQPGSARQRLQHQALHVLQRDWPAQHQADPFLNPNLALDAQGLQRLAARPGLAQGASRFARSAGERSASQASRVDEDAIRDLIFDPDWYLWAYPDIRKAGLDAYDHYRSAGWREGRLPCNDLALQRYAAINPQFRWCASNLILDILEQVRSGRFTLEQVRSWRGRHVRFCHGRSIHLEEGLAVEGFLNAELGIGQAARTLCRALDAARLRFRCHAYPLPGRDHEMEFTTKLAAQQRSRLAIAVLPLVDVSIVQPQLHPGRHNILYGVWELAEPPARWIRGLSSYDSLWVPSTYVQNCLAGEGFQSTLIPHAIPLVDTADAVLGQVRPDARLFTVLCFLDFDSSFARKNPLAAIRAFRLAFAGREQVRLIVKVHGLGGSCDRQVLWEATEGDPRIRVLDRTMNRREMLLLMASADCFLSLHRAEGFGFGCAEALALNKSVVATDYGGVTDFLTVETGYPVAYELIPVQKSEFHYHQPGQRWADASIEHAALQLRRACDDRGRAQQLAAAGRALLQRRYSVAAVGARVRALLEAEGLLSPQPCSAA